MITSIADFLLILGVVVLIAAFVGNVTKRLDGRRFKIVRRTGLAILAIALVVGFPDIIEGFKVAMND